MIISIDATGLDYGGFIISGLAGDNSWTSTHTVQNIDIPPGAYGFIVQSAGGNVFDFTVLADGTVTYAAGLSYLSGEGTTTLVVTGLSLSIDATQILGGQVWIRNAYEPAPITSGPITLLPGDHQLIVGSASISDFLFTVTSAGTFQYTQAFDLADGGCVTGQNTSSLTLVGYPIIVDAQDSGASALAIANVDATATDLVISSALMPYEDYRFILQSAVLSPPDEYLTVSPLGGALTLSPALAQHATIDRSGPIPVLRFLPPDTQLPAFTRITATALPDRTLALFALDPQRNITISVQCEPFVNGPWTPFAPLDGQADQLAGCRLTDGTATQLWKLDGGQLSVRVNTSATSGWSNWQPSQTPDQETNLVALTACALPEGGAVVIVCDTVGTLHSQEVNADGGIISDWAPVPTLDLPASWTGTPQLASTPDHDGNPLVFLNTDAVYVTTLSASATTATWLPWTPLTNPASVTSLAAANAPSGAATLFAISTQNGTVLTCQMEDNPAATVWSSWVEFPELPASAATTSITAARFGDLNSVIWTSDDHELLTSMMTTPVDNSPWTPAQPFTPLSPVLFDFGISNIDIEVTRSGTILGSPHDTDYVAVTVKIGTRDPISVTLNPALDVGRGQYAGISVSGVPVSATEIVTLAYSIVNQGKGDPSQIDQTLMDATHQLVDTAAQAAEDAISDAAVSVISDAAVAAIGEALGELVGAAAVPIVGAALGYLAGWLETQFFNFIFPDCDGPVAAGVHVMTGTQLRSLPCGGVSDIDVNTGSDAPTVCGDASVYNIRWFGRAHVPDTSVTLHTGYPLSNQSTGVRAPNGTATLVFQPDGNLVVYDENHNPRWASGTDGSGATCSFQSDGNLVVYDAAGNSVWASHTDNTPNAILTIQGDGNVVIYDPDVSIWATSTDH